MVADCKVNAEQKLAPTDVVDWAVRNTSIERDRVGTSQSIVKENKLQGR